MSYEFDKTPRIVVMAEDMAKLEMIADLLDEVMGGQPWIEPGEMTSLHVAYRQVRDIECRLRGMVHERGRELEAK